MRKILCLATIVFTMCGTASALEVIFTDGFEWGSVCAWSGDIWFPDLDIDLFGDETEPGIGWDCPSPADMVENNLDCDDSDPDINPNAVEVCTDAVDNDCDDLVDCDDSFCYDHPDCINPDPKINEVRYDDDSTDDEEYIELYHPDGTHDLTGYTLVHFNGANGSVIWTASLDGFSTLANGFFVLGQAGVDNLDVDWSTLGVSTLQNSAESLVLFTDWGGPGETVIDAVGWGDSGAYFMGEGDPAPEIELGAWNNTIGRHPDGADTDDNSIDFVQTWWPTPGEPNTPAQPEGFSRQAYSANGITPLPAAIPDDDLVGILLSMSGSFFPAPTITDLHVGVRIRHTYIGDLQVGLQSPTGTTVLLHNRTGSGTDNIMTVYDLETAPVDSLDVFNGEDPGGDFWTLFVNDNYAGDTGEVLEWVLWIADP